jgi:hypothetical protein
VVVFSRRSRDLIAALARVGGAVTEAVDGADEPRYPPAETCAFTRKRKRGSRSEWTKRAPLSAQGRSAYLSAQRPEPAPKQGRPLSIRALITSALKSGDQRVISPSLLHVFATWWRAGVQSPVDASFLPLRVSAGRCV